MRWNKSWKVSDASIQAMRSPPHQTQAFHQQKTWNFIQSDPFCAKQLIWSYFVNNIKPSKLIFVSMKMTTVWNLSCNWKLCQLLPIVYSFHTSIRSAERKKITFEVKLFFDNIILWYYFHVIQLSEIKWLCYVIERS